MKKKKQNLKDMSYKNETDLSIKGTQKYDHKNIKTNKVETDEVSTSSYNKTRLVELKREGRRDEENDYQRVTSAESEGEEETEEETEEELEEETEEEFEKDEYEKEEFEKEEFEKKRDETEEKMKMEEIKELANICIEKNMIVTKENMQIVKRLKEKKKLEEQINKNENINSLQEKRKILEEIEFHEWADREKRIKELQEKKMKLLKKIIEDRDAEKSEKIFYEVEKIIQKRDETKDRIIENFNKEKFKDMRNTLLKNQKNMKTIIHKKSDIIEDMTNYTSDYYLELERNGRIPDRLNESSSYRIDNLINANNLNKIEEMFGTDFYKSSNNILASKYGNITKCENRKNKQLISTFNRFLNKDATKASLLASNYFLNDSTSVQTKTQYMKFQFPDLHLQSKEEEAFEQKILVLQNTLRGKALKKLMMDGIYSYSDLIEELKTLEKIDKYSNEEREMLERENFDSIKIDSYVDNLQGKYVSELLDKLSSELEKYEEERKIAVMIKYAERERRLRECKDKGKRQAEILLREKEDYLFNEIMGLNNQTVDSYLEDIMGKTINDVSKEEALIRTKQKAMKVNEIYSSLENNEENNKIIIKELVGNFIISYVDEQRGIDMEKLDQRKNEYVVNFATQEILSKINKAF